MAASRPSSGIQGGSTTSCVNSATVPSPQAWGSRGRAAASATPPAIPTEVSRAEETTASSPVACTIARARRTPPRGWTLTTIRSAAPACATARGSVSLRTDSSAAIGVGMRSAARASRRRARPWMPGTGCSAYSRGTTTASRLSASSAVAWSQPALASIRTAASGRRRCTSATRARSASTPWMRGSGAMPGAGCSATLTLTAGTGPKRSSSGAICSAGRAGTVALTGTCVRTGSGQPCQPASIAAASQREDSWAPYSGNGENSAQPWGPRSSSASRTVVPRKRVRIGWATTVACSSSSSSGGRSAPVGRGGRGWAGSAGSADMPVSLGSQAWHLQVSHHPQRAVSEPDERDN